MITLPFNVYPLLRPFFFKMDPERAHNIVISCLKYGLGVTMKVQKDAVLKTTVCGMPFEHPIGLAAGFDKHAHAMSALFDIGFSFIELGAVTPKPQLGNPKPRMFRIPEAEAVINRFGFNSVGAQVFYQNLTAWLNAGKKPANKILGINVGKNKETVDAGDDYCQLVEMLSPHADFITVNVSSPNTPGLRNMQERGALTELLARVMKARAESGATKTKLFLKIAPDITDDQAKDIAEVALASGIDGMVVSNTTISRPAVIPADLAKEAGGLSGKPLKEMSTAVLAKMYQLTGGKLPIIGSGGISSGADAYAKIRAGASLVQVYTAMVYEGPQVVAKIARELAALLKRDGFASVADAVGADFKK